MPRSVPTSTKAPKRVVKRTGAYLVEHKDGIKNNLILGLSGATAMSMILITAISKTRDAYLEEKGLTEDFNTWLTAEPDAE